MWCNPPVNPDSLLRALPSLDRLLESPVLVAACLRHSRAVVRDAARSRLDQVRDALRMGLLDGPAAGQAVSSLAADVAADVDAASHDPYRRVLNATGVLVHTNLGRSPLSSRAAAAAWRAAGSSLALEYDLAAGTRGARTAPVDAVFEALFPGCRGLVVNNNASAILLVLSAVARDHEVVISRGELIEIGGSFRVPDILLRSGARLREVGTTNRTRIADYAAALGPATGAILRVHPSNFRQEGFTESAAPGELAELARQAGVPFVVDQGSGNLHDLTPFGIKDEPTVGWLLGQGADLVTFSGDKLLGGPQSGLVVGARTMVARVAADPLARALRPDKLILAALVETLRAHQRGTAFEDIPVLARLAAPLSSIQARAAGLGRALVAGGLPGDRVSLLADRSVTGGGSSPSGGVETQVVVVTPMAGGEERLAAALRLRDPAVAARVVAGGVRLDPRSLAPEEDALVAEAVCGAWRSLG